MSEVVTVSGSITGTIYGTFAAAGVYLGGMYGDQYTAWLALTTAQQKQTLISAARFLDRFTWEEDYDTFAERDAYVLDDGTTYPFVLASYELCALVAADPSVLTVADQSSNIQSLGAGGAQVTYFSPTSVERGTATLLPPILMRLIGGYLATPTLASGGGRGQEGSCVNPFSPCGSGRTDPW